MKKSTLQNETMSVLYIDDKETFNNSILEYLNIFFTNIVIAHTFEESLSCLANNAFDLIVIDFDIPHINGLEISQTIKNINPHQNIAMVSTCSEKEVLIKSMHIGVDGYITKPINKEQATLVLSKLCEKIDQTKANERYKEHLQAEVKRQVEEIRELEKEQEQFYKEFLFGLVNLIEERDSYTGGHSMRVAQYAKAIAKAMDLPLEVCDKVYEAGMLHDIGKTVIPDSILLKPDRFNTLEYHLIQQHVAMAQSILNKLTMFNDLVPIISSHHERIDGSGYPLGLKGHVIPIEAQIISVADCFDAMTTRRIYKNHTMTQEEALLEIENLIGKHFSEHVGFAALSYFRSIQLNQIYDQRPQSLLEYERFSFFFKDQLTKLYNQNFFDYLRLSNEHNYTFCSCLCIDKFYKYNDTYGWKEGDVLLGLVAEYLRTLFTQASLFRTKGDTFLILSNEEIHFDFNNFQTAISSKSYISFLLPIHNKSIDNLLNYLDL